MDGWMNGVYGKLSWLLATPIHSTCTACPFFQNFPCCCKVSILSKMAASQTTKRLICLWKGCDDVFEDAETLQEHVIKHVHEQKPMADLDTQRENGTEEPQQRENEQLAIATLDEEKMANEVDIGKQLKIICMDVVVWTDVLGFIKRIQLARTVSLTNRQINKICFPRLHGYKVEARQISFTITSQERSDRGLPPKALVLKQDKAIPIPKCPPLPYISGFNVIGVKFLDDQVFAFFTHILPRLAKHEDGVSISLKFDGSDAKQCALLDQLLNILRDGLPTNYLQAFCRMRDIQYLPEIDNKMQKISLCNESTSALEENIPIMIKMLASPRPDGQQRVIYLSMNSDNYIQTTVRAIEEDFRSASQPLAKPFYIYFSQLRDVAVVQRSVETNEKTDEQLTIMPVPITRPVVTNNCWWDNIIEWEICRHPHGQHEQWAEDGRKRIGSRFSSLHRINLDLTDA